LRESKLNATRAQIVIQRRQDARHDVKDDAWILPRQFFDDGQNDPLGHGEAASDTQFSGSGIREELDVLDSLLQLVEGNDSALEQRATVLRRPDPLGAAVEKPRADRLF